VETGEARKRLKPCEQNGKEPERDRTRGLLDGENEELLLGMPDTSNKTEYATMKVRGAGGGRDTEQGEAKKECLQCESNARPSHYE
jgi:hypothetical protein